MEAFVPLSNLHRPDAAWFIRQREVVSEPPERLWRAITDPAELARWWCGRSEVDLRPGGRFAFGGPSVWGDDPRMDPAAFEVLSIAPPERLEFRWPLRGVDTTVLIELAAIVEGAELVVTQTAPAPPPGAPPEGSHNWWSVTLPSLRSYLEGGRADLRLDYPALRAAEELRFQVEVTTFPWVVWGKLTDPAQLDRWIARGARVDLRPGGVYDLGPGPGPRRVLEVEPEKLLVHDFEEPGRPDSRVSWRIVEGGESTSVTLTDHGPLPPAGDAGRRDGRTFRWAGAVLHLKQFSERGVTPREYQEG